MRLFELLSAQRLQQLKLVCYCAKSLVTRVGGFFGMFR